jgi:hypothetical protein
MFNGQKDAKKKAARIVQKITHYAKNKAHDRHIHLEECQKIGLNVKSIEHDALDENGQKDVAFQDLILTVHHCYMHTLMNTTTYKIIENHLGTGICKNQAVNPPAGPKANPNLAFS